ncbi:hypothetical protein [Saccharothrix sp. NRRL B-16314]|uniref:hypothetical protein n=1 Tax=Saccharothrix sp. NRRL B-16314 TaxID=1463825 RepID=UPI0012DE6D10|nr:hypothetical protein [Saccharothrix sp. NRRL B-16314]
MVHGPAEGLKLIDALDERLPCHCRLDAVRAHLREMAGTRRALWRTTRWPPRARRARPSSVT